MQIKTEHDLGDQVYVVHRNAVFRGKVLRILVDLQQVLGNTVTYERYSVQIPKQSAEYFDKGKVFATKEELLASL